jgi:hypothetical protein
MLSVMERPFNPPDCIEEIIVEPICKPGNDLVVSDGERDRTGLGRGSAELVAKVVGVGAFRRERNLSIVEACHIITTLVEEAIKI